MIFCIDKSAIESQEYVQKSVSIEDLLQNHTKYYEQVSDALKDNFVPLYISTSIRTLFTNFVLKCSEGNYYSMSTPSAELVHKGYDLAMYMASLNVFEFLEYKDGFDEFMMDSTMFQPIGLYYNSEDFALIYTHILVSDKSIRKMLKFFKQGTELISISQMDFEGKIKALLNELIIVEEDSDGRNYSN